MNYCNNEEEEIKKFSAELKEMKKSQPVGVKVPEIAIFAMITQIQLASKHPNATSEFTEIAISVAVQLQKIFKKHPVTYEILEMKWQHREHDRPIKEEEIKKFSAELKEIKKSQPVSVKMPKIAIFAMITQIQLASQHPNATSEFTEIAISAAVQLQEIFKKYPVSYEILEMGWNREHDRQIKHEQ